MLIDRGRRSGLHFVSRPSQCAGRPHLDLRPQAMSPVYLYACWRSPRRARCRRGWQRRASVSGSCAGGHGPRSETSPPRPRWDEGRRCVAHDAAVLALWPRGRPALFPARFRSIASAVWLACSGAARRLNASTPPARWTARARRCEQMTTLALGGGGTRRNPRPTTAVPDCSAPAGTGSAVDLDARGAPPPATRAPSPRSRASWTSWLPRLAASGGEARASAAPASVYHLVARKSWTRTGAAVASAADGRRACAHDQRARPPYASRPTSSRGRRQTRSRKKPVKRAKPATRAARRATTVTRAELESLRADLRRVAAGPRGGTPTGRRPAVGGAPGARPWSSCASSWSARPFDGWRRGTLEPQQIEDMGLALMRLRRPPCDMAARFGLTPRS